MSIDTEHLSPKSLSQQTLKARRRLVLMGPLFLFIFWGGLPIYLLITLLFPLDIIIFTMLWFSILAFLYGYDNGVGWAIDNYKELTLKLSAGQAMEEYEEERKWKRLAYLGLPAICFLGAFIGVFKFGWDMTVGGFVVLGVFFLLLAFYYFQSRYP